MNMFPSCPKPISCYI